MEVAPSILALAALTFGLPLGLLAIRAWSRRAMPTAGPLALTLAALCLWLLAQSLCFAVEGLHDKLLAKRLIYVGIALFPSALLVLSLRASGLEAWTSRPVLAVLALEPTLAVALTLTNASHGWMWDEVRLVRDAGATWLYVGGGPAFWAHALYSHALVTAAIAVFARKYLRDPRRYRWEGAALAAGLGLPWLANAGFLAGGELVAHVDLTPYAAAAAVGLLAWLGAQDHFLDPVPLARSRVLEELEDAVLVVDARQRVVDANRAFLRLLGREGLPSDLRVASVLHGHEALQRLLAEPAPTRADLVLRREGASRVFEARVGALAEHRGRAAGRALVLRDVTEGRAVETRLRASEERYRGIVEEAAEAIVQMDASGRIESGNAAAATLLGAPVEGLRGRPISDWLPAEEHAELEARLRLLMRERSLRFEMRIRRSDGRAAWCRASLTRVGPDRVQLIALDDSGRRAAEERVRHLSHYDGLTGLPNRRLFEWQVERALAAASARPLAVLFVDLDGFKEVNDSLGHGLGDELLRQAASRFVHAVRTRDLVGRPGEAATPPDEMPELSRLGGDEFSLLLPELRDPRDALTVARRLLEALTRPFRLDGHEVAMLGSIGIAVHPGDGDDVETLLRRADRAMHAAKAHGPGQIRFYESAMEAEGPRRLRLEARLRGALERGDLSLVYQPIRDAHTAGLLGVEALLRWTDAELGEVGPEEFVPVAEQSGAIVAIGRWVLRRVCEEMVGLEVDGRVRPRVAINVAGRELEEPGFAEGVLQAVRSSGLGPGGLELEITERALWRCDAGVRERLEQLAHAGVGLALDDFGVGHSSLSRLRDLPIHRVKIDRDFVRGIPAVDDGRFASAVIAMAHHLGMPVVAEGVEREEQATFLRERGCDALQGWLVGRPVPAEGLRALLDPAKPAGTA